MSNPIDAAKSRYAEARVRQSASRTVLFQAIPNWPELPDMLTPSQKSAILDAIRFEDELGEHSTRWHWPARLVMTSLRPNRVSADGEGTLTASHIEGDRPRF